MIVMNARKFASFVKCEMIGDPLKEVTKPSYLHTAKNDELAYCYLKNDDRDLEAIRKSKAGILICSKHLKAKLAGIKISSTLILSETPKYDFAKILQTFFVTETPSISPLAYVAANVTLGTDVDIHPNVVIYGNVQIGNKVTVRANAVLGAEGLDYGANTKGELERVPHLSSLIVGDNADIGSNTTVQKGILRPTIIGRGSKIGPNCNIGHEVVIGKNCIVTGMTIIAGATEIGDNTFIAPHSTIKNSIKIGKNVLVGIGSLVINNIPDNSTVVGRPAIELKKFRANRKRLKELLGES